MENRQNTLAKLLNPHIVHKIQEGWKWKAHLPAWPQKLNLKAMSFNSMHDHSILPFCSFQVIQNIHNGINLQIALHLAPRRETC